MAKGLLCHPIQGTCKKNPSYGSLIPRVCLSGTGMVAARFGIGLWKTSLQNILILHIHGETCNFRPCTEYQK